MSWRPKRLEEIVTTTHGSQYDIRATLDHHQILTITVTEASTQTEYQQEFCQIHFNQHKIQHIAQTLIDALKPLHIRQRCKIFTHADWCYLTVDNGSDFPSFALPKVDPYAAQKKSIRIYRSSPCLHSAYSDPKAILEDEEDQKMDMLTPTSDTPQGPEFPDTSKTNKTKARRARTLSKPPPVTSDMLVNYGVLSADYNVNRHNVPSLSMSMSMSTPNTNNDTNTGYGVNMKTNAVQNNRQNTRTAALQRARHSAPPPRALPRPPRRAEKRYVAPPPRIQRHPSAPSLVPAVVTTRNEYNHDQKQVGKQTNGNMYKHSRKPIVPKHGNASSMDDAQRYYDSNRPRMVHGLQSKSNQSVPQRAKPPMIRHAKSAKSVYAPQRPKPVPVKKEVKKPAAAAGAAAGDLEQEIYQKLEKVYNEYVAEKDERPGNTFDLINYIQFKGVKGINFKHVGKFLLQYQSKEVNVQN